MTGEGFACACWARQAFPTGLPMEFWIWYGDALKNEWAETEGTR